MQGIDGQRFAIAAWAMARRVRILGAESPQARSVASAAPRMVAGDTAPRTRLVLAQMALALATESCWLTMMLHRPEKPG
jgi:hypothetical protein